MRPFHPVLSRALLAVTLAVTVLVGLAFLPPVQSWLVEWRLASLSPLDLQVGRASVGPGHVSLENLELRTNGFALKAPHVEAELSVFALLRGRLDCSSITAEGLRIQCNLSQTEASGSLGCLLPSLLGGRGFAARRDTTGQGLRVLRLDRLRLDGDMRVALVSGHAPGDLHLTLDGGNLGGGKSGRLALALESRGSSPEPVERIAGRFGFSLSMDQSGSLTRLESSGGLEAAGGLLNAPAHLDLESRLEAGPDGRQLQFQLLAERRLLASVKGAWPAHGQGFSGQWVLDLKPADLSPFLRSGSFPATELAGSGTLAVDRGVRRVQLGGRLDGSLDHLDRLGTRWAGLGRVGLHADFDLEEADSLLLVRSLGVRLESGEARLELLANRPLSADLSKGALMHQSEQGRLLSLRFTGVPSFWIHDALPRLSLEGGSLGGGLGVECREDGWSLTSLSPLECRALSLSMDGKALLRGVDLSLEMRVDVLAGGWQLELSRLSLREGSDVFLDGLLRLGRLSKDGSPLVSMGRCELDLPPCSRQPACAWLAPLAGGHAAAEFQFSAGDIVEGHGVFRAEGLVPASGGAELPRLGLELGLRRDGDGVLHLEAPLRLEGPGEAHTSELRLTGELRPGNGIRGVDLSVTGSRLFADQLKPFLGGLFRLPAADVPVPGADCPWCGLEGVLQFNVAQCVIDAQHRLEPLSGRLRISPDALGFEQFRARQLPGTGGLQFDGSLLWKDGLYDLGGTFAADGFDTAFLLQLLGAPAWNGLSARFDAKGTLHATAPAIDALLTGGGGQMELLSKGGTCRLLGTDLGSFLAKKPSASSGITSSIGALLGLRSQEPAKEAARLDGPSRMALDLADSFSQIPFDQLSVNLAWEPGGEIQLQDISLIAPLVRLSGSGTIHAQPGVSLLARPLDLRLGVLVRGRFSEMLGKAGQLDGVQDPLGYNGFVEGLHVGGSLATPDTSDLRNRLLKLSFSKSSDDFFRRILGGR